MEQTTVVGNFWLLGALSMGVYGIFIVTYKSIVTQAHISFLTTSMSGTCAVVHTMTGCCGETPKIIF